MANLNIREAMRIFGPDDRAAGSGKGREVKEWPAAAVGELAGAFEEQTIRVPLRGEEAVVEKHVVMTGEVVIEKARVTERRQVSDTVRKERVEIDENYQQARPGFQVHFNRRDLGGRTWEEAEPNYRRGYEAAYDERYADREFDDVEPELRREYEAGGGTSFWDRLREEIREGWDRARGR